MENEMMHGSDSCGDSSTNLAQFKREVEAGGERIVSTISLGTDPWTISGEMRGFKENGVLFYDLKNVGFINNTGMTKILELLKSLLKDGIEVRFINVNEKIRQKIKSLGLDHILICV